MQFSRRGRLQTRLILLLIPGCLALGWTFSPYRDAYWKLFVLMSTVGLSLDMGVYVWLIGYQPRWATIALGVFEFFILKWLIEFPYPLEIHLRTKSALLFYITSWFSGWLLLHIALPYFFPKWREDGGVLWRPAADTVAHRRRSFLECLGLSMFLLLPWATAMINTQVDMQFTGLLLPRPIHHHDLAQLVRGDGIFGRLPALLHIDVLDTYLLLRVIVTFAWLLCTSAFAMQPRSSRFIICLVPPLLLPLSGLFWLLVCGTLIAYLGKKHSRYTLPHPIQHFGWLLLIMVLGSVWGNVFSDKAFLYKSEFQAVYYLQQKSTLGEYTVTASPALVHLLPTLTDNAIVNMDGCANPVFEHGHTIICELTSSAPPLLER